MPDMTMQKTNCVLSTFGMVCAFLAALFFFMGLGTGEASPLPHSHKAGLVSAGNINADKHSCPLLHHLKREVCPLSHQTISVDGVVIKSCGGSPAEGGISVAGFSKVTVAPDGFNDFRLPESGSSFTNSSFYIPVLPVPLDHPPRSI